MGRKECWLARNGPGRPQHWVDSVVKVLLSEATPPSYAIPSCTSQPSGLMIRLPQGKARRAGSGSISSFFFGARCYNNENKNNANPPAIPTQANAAATDPAAGGIPGGKFFL